MKKLLYILVLAVLPWFSLGCEKEGFADESEVRLAFSADTLTFDTVFTTMGTTTLRLTVYNRSSDNVCLSSVTLAGGRSSRFRLNVDGDTSMVARDVEILAGDSIFIFVQANINPTDNQSPFLVEDAIVFSNGQRLPLTAYGRNAIYHKATEGNVLRINSETWSDSLPHIVVGIVIVQENQTLKIDPGAEVYFANDAALIIDSAARLLAQGLPGDTIRFTSLRHDGYYSYLPGQWSLIWFYSFSEGNRMDYTIVENGIGGLRCYPLSSLNVTNSIIRNMSDCAIVGQNATVKGTNLLVYDCLTSFMALMGGDYDFRQCTFADYWTYSSRDIESVVLSNQMMVYGEDGSPQVVASDLVRADFINCILWGTYSSGEVLLSAAEGYLLAYRFVNSIVRGGDRDEDPLFTDPYHDDYTLQEDSPAAGLGYRF